MTDEERDKLMRLVAQFGLLALSFLFAASSSAALLFFLLRLLQRQPEFGSFDAVKERARETLQTDFERIVDELATHAEADLPNWGREMGTAIEGYLIAQATAAKGRALLPSELLDIERDTIRTQMDYFAGFREDLGRNEHTRDYISARSKLYAGAGRALWYRIAEADAADGWVVDYISVDDSGTCSPCINAEANGPYLFGEGPYPGEVCLGRGRCRCQRQPRFDLAAWEKLSAERFDFAA
jgi:hypothetical protein